MGWHESPCSPPHNSTSLVLSDSLVPTDYKTNLLPAINWFMRCLLQPFYHYISLDGRMNFWGRAKKIGNIFNHTAPYWSPNADIYPCRDMLWPPYTARRQANWIIILYAGSTFISPFANFRCNWYTQICGQNQQKATIFYVLFGCNDRSSCETCNLF